MLARINEGANGVQLTLLIVTAFAGGRRSAHIHKITNLLNSVSSKVIVCNFSLFPLLSKRVPKGM